jgi:hypothetical protein
LEFIKLIKKVNQVTSHVIDESGTKPLLITPPAGSYGAWVLVPAVGDFSQIQQFVSNILSNTSESSDSATNK